MCMFRMKHQNNICQGKSDKKGVFASLIVRLIGKTISLVPYLPSVSRCGGREQLQPVLRRPARQPGGQPALQPHQPSHVSYRLMID